MKNSINRKVVFTLANKLKSALGFSQSAALKLSYKAVRKYNLQLIEFTKKNKEVVKRVVSFDWMAFNKPKGERSKPEGLNLFTDFVKVLSGKKHHTISTYSYAIL